MNLVWINDLPEYFALLWVLALIPPFLLAYHRGWEGAAIALAAGMVLLLGVEVGGSVLTERAIRWWVLGSVIVVLIGVSIGAGLVTDRLQRRESDALWLASVDPLTGMSNRRLLELFLPRQFAAAQRGVPLAIAMLDVDGFKSYNDSRGHPAGDEVLRLVARVLTENTRAMDLSGRYGGDEFLALLQGVEVVDAEVFGERVRREVAAAAQPGEPVTVSVGVAAFDPGMETFLDLVEAADRALYVAKKLGGNRVVTSGAEPPPSAVERDAPP